MEDTKNKVLELLDRLPDGICNSNSKDMSKLKESKKEMIENEFDKEKNLIIDRIQYELSRKLEPNTLNFVLNNMDGVFEEYKEKALSNSKKNTEKAEAENSSVVKVVSRNNLNRFDLNLESFKQDFNSFANRVEENLKYEKKSVLAQNVQGPEASEIEDIIETQMYYEISAKLNVLERSGIDVESLSYDVKNELQNKMIPSIIQKNSEIYNKFVDDSQLSDRAVLDDISYSCKQYIDKYFEEKESKQDKNENEKIEEKELHEDNPFKAELSGQVIDEDQVARNDSNKDEKEEEKSYKTRDLPGDVII